MPFPITQKKLIREMSAEEIQAHADDLYARCNCDPLSLAPSEHAELKECSNQYFHLTGEALKASTCN